MHTILPKRFLVLLSLVAPLLITTLIFFSLPAQAAGAIHVNAAAGNGGNGTDWPNAYNDLQTALNAASAGDEIWVASGVYTPGATVSDTFQLLDGVAIYGGFAATETDRAQRDWGANITVLSGDIAGDDTVDTNNVVTDTDNINGTNNYHVVTGNGVTTTALLDGFTITAGSATKKFVPPNNRGGGMINDTGSPTLSNISFSGNLARERGGGMFNTDSSPTLINVSFNGNTAGSFGGGGMANANSSPILINVVFMNNSVLDSIGTGGGMLNNDSNPTLTNVTFSKNSAGFGGGIFNSTSSLTITNSIFWNNQATFTTNPLEDNIQNSNGTASISYSLIENSGGSGGSWAPALGSDGGNNIDVDPLFVSGTAQLKVRSPAIDVGSNISYTGAMTDTDLAGNPRFQNTIIDMGAYEFTLACPTENILFVDHSAGGADTGGSWADSYINLQDALALAHACPADIAEIWVASGVYTPGATVSDTFQLLDGVAIYGGFAATETDRAQRDWGANITVLSGDIDSNDTPHIGGVLTDTANISGTNSYHVVTGSGVTTTAVLDGFTITAGNANGTNLTARGSGMLNDNGNPTLNNIVFSANLAKSGGGGIYNSNSSPALFNVTFSANSSGLGGGGGGMQNVNNSHPTLTNVTFAGNSAVQGGGMDNGSSSPTLTNVSFAANSATIGGGMRNINSSSPVLTNVTFSANSASLGGGMHNSNSSNPTLINNIVWGNKASNGDNLLNQNSSTPVISYSLIEGSGGSGSWDNSLGVDAGNNIDGDPLFVTPINPRDAPTTIGNLQLMLGSPAIDVGNTLSYTSPITTDLAGNIRIQNGVIDMGAYEFVCEASETLFVNHAAGGENDGSSWENSFTSLQNALTIASLCPIVTEIWVASGVYTPGATVSDTFQLLDDVAIYGGFAATETARSERSWEANLTVLSGDIDNNDTPHVGGVLTDTANITGTNSYHVVTGSGVTTTAVLNGFTITAGYADGDSSPHTRGGGMYNDNGSPTLTHLTFSANSAKSRGGGVNNLDSSPILTNVIFFANSTHGNGDGGGMYNSNSHPTLTNVTFSSNVATSNGGGLENGSDSSPVLTNVTFSNNIATNGDGGGMYNSGSNPILTNVIFYANLANDDDGGGMGNYQSSPELTNVTFSANSADDDGGGLFNSNNSNPTLTNVTFSANSAGGDGGGMGNYASNPTAVNTVFWGNSASTNANIGNQNSSIPIISYSLVEGSGGSASWDTNFGTDGGSNIDSDPLFVTPVSASDAPTTTGNLQLLPGSPAIDAGNTLSYTNPITTDLVGNARIQNGVIDMGAYEFIPFYDLMVALTGDGTGSISSLPAGIDCGITCTAAFDSGQIVTLTATADASSTFTGWSGAGCTGTADCVITIDAAKSVTATFELSSYMLTTITDGTGSGTISKSPDALTYTHGTTVTLTATANTGSTFTGWSGAGCTGTGNCVVTMDGAKSVTATFIDNTIYLPLIISATQP